MKFVALLGFATTIAHAEPGYFASVGAGANTTHPFGEVTLGRRFVRAPFFELGLAYSYDARISALPFQTLGLAMRTYVGHVAGVEIFQQGTAALALSSSGRFGDRAIGDRLLGAMLTVGVGADLAIDRCWSVSLAVSTGTPVWLRSEVAVRYAF